MRHCKIDGCELVPSRGKGICNRHYYQLNKDKYQKYYRAHKKEKQAYNNINARTPDGKYCYAVAIARKRNLEWCIDKETYKSLIASGCSYCGRDLCENRGVALDRINNAKGYTVDNVRPCCGFCNSIRGDLLSPKETQAVVDLLKSMRAKDNLWDGYVMGQKRKKNSEAK